MSSLLAGTSLLFGDAAPEPEVAVTEGSPTSGDDSHEKEKHWLIINATRNQGYALTQLLLDNDTPCTAFIDSDKRDEVVRFFGRNDNLSVFTGDVTKDVGTLDQAAQKATHLYFAPEFEGYSSWAENMKSALATCLAIAHQHKLHVVFPAARSFAFDGYAPDEKNTVTLTATLPFLPQSKQGQTLMALENNLHRHAYENKLPVTIIRTGHPFGPNVKDTLTFDSFHDAFHTKKFLWIYRDDLPFQYCYTGDIAQLAEVATDNPSDDFVTTLHLAGYYYDSALDFGHDIVRQAHNDKNEYARQRLVGGWTLSLISLAKPDAKRGIDIRRSFETSFLLDDSATLTSYPTFSPTPKEEAIRATLEWHRLFTLS